MPRLGLSLCLLLAGCATSPVYYQYPGQPRGSAQESVLVLGDGGNVVVDKLDGKELPLQDILGREGYAQIREIHLTPGIHTIAGRAAAGKSRSTFSSFYVTRDFRSGHRYGTSVHLIGYQISIEIKED
jgi:hypothetical protein